MTDDATQRFRSIAHTALRIAAGIAFFTHGAQKLLGWFGGMGPDGGTAELMSRAGAAGLIETVAGLAIALGLFTRPLAFVASGEMAVAYFWAHVGQNGQLWWWQNRGELALVYCFLWLFYSASGAGRFSLDAWLARRKATTPSSTA
jgi:putative oxidoreductase